MWLTIGIALNTMTLAVNMPFSTPRAKHASRQIIISM
jgi:hypothetical protein